MAAAALVVPASANAAPEDMDTSFSGDGLVPTGVGTEGNDIAIDSEGRILATFSQSGNNAGVVRLLPNGAFDSSFSGDGIARYPGIQTATRIAVDSQDRPVFAGWISTGSGTVAANVVRFTESGSLDNSFDGNGSRGLGDWVVTALQIRPDDRLILALVPPALALGGQGSGPSIVLQLTSSGAPDPSFGAPVDGGGVAPITFAFPGWNSLAIEDLVLGADGKVTMAVSIDCCVRSGVVRLLATGSPDPTLNEGQAGQSGYAELPSSWGLGRGVTVDSSGRTLLTGTTPTSQGERSYVARLISDGRADGTFGTAGLTIADLGIGADYPLDVQVAPDGKVLVAGESSSSDVPFSFLLGRFTTAGILDTTFSQDGIASGQIGLGMRLALDSSQRVVMVGWGDGSATLGPRHTLIARYLQDGSSTVPDGPEPPPPGGGGGGTGGVAGVFSDPDVNVHRVIVPRSRAKLAKRGVRVLASCDEDCTIFVEVRVSRRIASALGLPSTLIAQGFVLAGAGKRRWVRARSFSSTVRRALRSFTGAARLRINVSASPPALP